MEINPVNNWSKSLKGKLENMKVVILSQFSKMKRNLFESIWSPSFQQKIDKRNWDAAISLTSAVCFSFAHIDELVQTTPKCSQLKDQKTGVIDESSSDMDTLLIGDMYSPWLLK